MARRRSPGRSGHRQTERSRRLTPRRTPQDTVRATASWVLERTLATSAPVSHFLPGVVERFDERDQALLRELVLGTLRWLRRIDHVIGLASDRSFDRIERALRGPLRVGTYQLLFMDRVPPYAVVDEAVEQARQLTHRGGASFVNAVLRRIARSPQPDAWPVEESNQARRLAVEMSHPDFLVQHWLDRWGWERTSELLLANNQPKPIQLLSFRDRGGREVLAEQLIDSGLEVEPSPVSPFGLTVRQGNPFATEAFRRGDAYVQDEASQLAAWIPPPGPGERIYDAAAAPGGKSFAILAMEPEARLIVGELSLPRLLTLRENQRRLGRDLPLVLSDAADAALAPGLARVILDLPCSGTGTLRKHPEIKWRLSPSGLRRLSRQAARLLDGGADLVAPGGLLVASTCSLEREENEEVVASFLDRHPDFRLLPLADRLPPWLSEGLEGDGRWRLLTAGDHDGFTVHVLERTA